MEYDRLAADDDGIGSQHWPLFIDPGQRCCFCKDNFIKSAAQPNPTDRLLGLVSVHLELNKKDPPLASTGNGHYLCKPGTCQGTPEQKKSHSYLYCAVDNKRPALTTARHLEQISDTCRKSQACQ